MIFSGNKNLFLTFSEVNGVSSIVKIVLDILEGQKRPSGVQLSATVRKIVFLKDVNVEVGAEDARQIAVLAQ